MSTQSVRLADVAQRAGTSTKTASRVLNGDPRVADDTRRRVQDAMNELGYQVDVLARSLRTGVDETIAVVVPPATARSIPGSWGQKACSAQTPEVTGRVISFPSEWALAQGQGYTPMWEWVSMRPGVTT